jgi:hypothetical protein
MVSTASVESRCTYTDLSQVSPQPRPLTSRIHQTSNLDPNLWCLGDENAGFQAGIITRGSVQENFLDPLAFEHGPNRVIFSHLAEFFDAPSNEETPQQSHDLEDGLAVPGRGQEQDRGLEPALARPLLAIAKHKTSNETLVTDSLKRPNHCGGSAMKLTSCKLRAYSQHSNAPTTSHPNFFTLEKSLHWPVVRQTFPRYRHPPEAPRWSMDECLRKLKLSQWQQPYLA